MANKTSQHILGTATNLLGFCLIVISSLHIANKTQNSLADEFTSIIAVLLTLSCILSFLSIKTINSKREEALERIADQLFFIALFGILAIIIFLTIKLWNN
jgi:Ca2+/H+ antiporter